ncbi:MAG: ATP-binding protein [Candidatus Melainabacteria bacterium]|nr:ATP-binding protein [Candidatus Melainabacteria bacterium]
MRDLLPWLKELLEAGSFVSLVHTSSAWSPVWSVVYLLSHLGIGLGGLLLALGLLRRLPAGAPAPLRAMVRLAGVMTLALSLMHCFSAWMGAYPAYRLLTLLQVVAAVTVWVNVLGCLYLLPKLTSLRSPWELECEIAIRAATEQRLQQLNEHLEAIVAERTEALARQSQALEMKNRELETFNRMASHDLNAPLRRVRFFAETLRQQHAHPLSDIGKDCLVRLCQNAEAMHLLLQDLLALARMGQQPIQPVRVNLSELAQEWFQQNASQWKPARLAATIEPDIHVVGDPVLLRTAMENLLSNACKYSRGRPRICIKIRRLRLGLRTVVCVRDNGSGFNMAEVKGLFSPFHRLTHAQEFPGTGLGLASVRRVMDLHGGRVWARGEVEEGAAFYLHFPAQGLTPGSNRR